jgi:hypothetical protein
MTTIRADDFSEVTPPRRVILESPFWAADEAGIAENVAYAKRCARDCLMRKEAPFASHLIYPAGILDDNLQTERILGIRAGLAWGTAAEATVVYTDRGISRGMEIGIEDAKRAGRVVEYRKLGD